MNTNAENILATTREECLRGMNTGNVNARLAWYYTHCGEMEMASYLGAISNKRMNEMAREWRDYKPCADDTRQREHAEAPEPSRAAQMANVARSAMHLLRIARPNRDIRIEYHRADDESNENLTQWQREKFHLWMNDEYFMVWDDAPEWDAPGSDLLYVVNVSADSLLTAAAELFELLHRKF